MVTVAAFRKLAMAYPETEELPHFEKTSFRCRKKIFATLAESQAIACLKLPAIEQSVFCAMDKDAIYPVPNKWGKQGWTLVELNHVNPELFQDALTLAYCEVAPKKLSEAYRD